MSGGPWLRPRLGTAACARAEGKARGRRRGRREGTAAGTSAGRQAVASGGNGPSVLPPPKLASNLTVVPAEDFAERPASITVGNHSVLELLYSHPASEGRSVGREFACGGATRAGPRGRVIRPLR